MTKERLGQLLYAIGMVLLLIVTVSAKFTPFVSIWIDVVNLSVPVILIVAGLVLWNTSEAKAATNS